MKEVSVAVAVILDEQQQVLIAKRAKDQHQGGLWEFPGGKIEPGEHTPEALIRELNEELAMDASGARMTPLIGIRHQYSDKAVHLDVYLVEVTAAVAQQARGAEGQQICWVQLRQLNEFEFPAANLEIIQRLQQKP